MKLNVNKKRLLLLGGIGLTLLLCGCSKNKSKDKTRLYPVNNLGQEENTIMGMVLDNKLDKNEKELCNKYTYEELIAYYEEASIHVTSSYINGYEDVGYRAIIKDYPKVVNLHEQFFDTYHDTSNQSIKDLYMDIREFITSDNSFEEDILANPIIMASQALYYNNPYSLMREELVKLNNEDVLSKAEEKIKVLRKEEY